jgi:hypothetical protein
VNDVALETIHRRSDEPELEIGSCVEVKANVMGVVLARYTPSAHKEEVRYIVAVPSEKHGCRTRKKDSSAPLDRPDSM